MSMRLRTGVEAELVTVRGRKYDPSESVGLGVGGMKSANDMPTYLSW
jgi:hypothetical protein